jgi:hypothetical protein
VITSLSYERDYPLFSHSHKTRLCKVFPHVIRIVPTVCPLVRYFFRFALSLIPSTNSSIPVTELLSFEARNKTTLASIVLHMRSDLIYYSQVNCWNIPKNGYDSRLNQTRIVITKNDINDRHPVRLEINCRP